MEIKHMLLRLKQAVRDQILIYIWFRKGIYCFRAQWCKILTSKLLTLHCHRQIPVPNMQQPREVTLLLPIAVGTVHGTGL